jgi:regulator of sigma E protease
MTLLYFILFIGVLIFVHEMGHFLFAKLFDVKVIKFSLGFGPRAVGFRKGETEYCVAWVPLGGFVKMLGEDPQDEIRPEDQGRAFNQKPLWQRYIVVLAGPTFNLLFPIIIYFVFFAAQTTLSPSVIGKAFSGQPAAEAGLAPGDRIVAIDGRAIRYWEDLQVTISQNPGRRLRFTVEREGSQFERFITPREQVIRNWLNMVEEEGRIGISPLFEPAQIGVSDPASPAARAGLRTGDLATAVNGAVVERWSQLERIIAANRGESLSISFLRPSASVSSFMDLRHLTPLTTVVDPEPSVEKGRKVFSSGIQSAEFFIREVEKGSPAEKIGLRAGDRLTHFDGMPVKHWDVILITLQEKRDADHSLTWVSPGGREHTSRFKLAHLTYIDEYHQEQQRWVFGAQNYRIWKSAEPVAIDGRFTYALSKSVRQTGEIVGMMTIAIVQLFRGAIPRDSIGGPLMLAYTARVAAEKGWDHFLRMLALISINLGILNLLPIPILDGGHILFFTFEAVKRRQVSLRVREIATYIGLVLLISLMVFAFKNDIVRYWFK